MSSEWIPQQHQVLSAADLIALVDTKLRLGDGRVAVMAASIAVASSDATAEQIHDACSLVLAEHDVLSSAQDDPVERLRLEFVRDRRVEALTLSSGALTRARG